MTVNEKAYEYLIEKLEDTVVITATAPKSLENFQVMLKESEYSVSYYGIKFVTKELPENLQFAMGPVFQLLDVLKMEPGSQQPGRNGTVSVSYDVGGTQLECTFDSETKLPVKIVYNSDTTIEFLEFTNLTTQSADEQTGTQLEDAADAETGAPGRRTVRGGNRYGWRFGEYGDRCGRQVCGRRCGKLPAGGNHRKRGIEGKTGC